MRERFALAGHPGHRQSIPAPTGRSLQAFFGVRAATTICRRSYAVGMALAA
jgi:hypothetical protein